MTTTNNDHKNIHEAILGVMREVGYVQKQRSGGLNYSYAGEAALIAALRPAMIQHGIIAYVSSSVFVREQFTTAKGTPMNTTIMQGSVTFVHAPSDTCIIAEATGEGMDVGDKSANKAATGLLKYALRQTFLIETGDDPDTTPSSEQERKVEPDVNANAKANGRPYPPETVKAKITEMVTKNKDAKIHENHRKVLAAVLDTTFDGETTMRYELCQWLVGVASTKKMTAAQVRALLTWLGVDRFEDIPSEYVIAEARSCHTAALEAGGQAKLFEQGKAGEKP